MIKSIHLANEGPYDATGASIQDLKCINFFFGPNGSGKTTISRVISDSQIFPNCNLIWAGGSPLETCVYNKDFVENHFDAESSIKGIYTFGKNIEVNEKIGTLTQEAEQMNAKLTRWRSTLCGEDGVSGKVGERKTLVEQFVEDVWSAKRQMNDLNAAFTGLNNNKQRFYEKYLLEASSNASTLRDIAELREEADMVYSDSLTKAAPLPVQDGSEVLGLEDETILKKIIVGKEDVDIAALIEKLGNSDWVQSGRQYFEQLEGQCPFCQQKTDADFRQSLEAYFDDSYIADLSAVDNLLANYLKASSDLLEAYRTPDIIESSYLNRELLEQDVAALELLFTRNIELIQAKKTEPSVPVTLLDAAAKIARVKAQVTQANRKIAEKNNTIDNLASRKAELTSQIWRRPLEDSKSVYNRHRKKNEDLGSAIMSLQNKIDSETNNLQAKRKEIVENEQKITSIKPTINSINEHLKSFGFTNFHLVESTNSGFYEIEREDGRDAKRTLSEGEKSFITFLYFYHLIDGSFSSSGSTTDKVVVFDDPVSSLDADILFIVCNLIKTVFAKMRSDESPVKQAFVFTHNIYFHKEVTFDKNRNATKAKQDETFWIVRKTSQRSELENFEDNPIKSSYELLWREVRRKPPSYTNIQNVMRRILEHYFKFYGGVTPDNIVDKFDGKDKMICGTLLSWVNDGSHFASDDLYMACEPGQVDRYLNVFQKIFEESGHAGHFSMMMGDDYVALPGEQSE